MTSNLPNASVTVQCNGDGYGREEITSSAPSEIDSVVMGPGDLGYPKILPADHPANSVVQVLGAIPDSAVTVKYYSPNVERQALETQQVETEDESGDKASGSSDTGDSGKSKSTRSKPAPSSD